MKKCTFVAAVLFSALTFVACSKSEVVINSIADLEMKKIGVQAGTTGESWVQVNVPGVKLSSFKTGIDAALDLKNGTIDAVVIDELPAKEIVARNPDLKIVRDQAFADNKEEYAIAVKKGNTSLLNSINSTIANMKSNGDYEALVAAFMPADGAIAIPANIALSGSNTVKLGTNAAFPPYEYKEKGKVLGIDAMIAQAICDELGYKLVIDDMEFDSIIPAVQTGKADFGMAGMTVTKERLKAINFSDPYATATQVIIVKE